MASAVLFFSCIITPQSRETSPIPGVPGIGTSFPGTPVSTAPPPETITPSSPPDIDTSVTSPPETILRVDPPIIGASVVSLPETIPWVDLPETITQPILPEKVPGETPPEETPPEETLLVAAVSGQPVVEMARGAAVIPPLRLDKPPVPEHIIGRGVIPPKEMAAFLLESNTGAEKTFIEELAYIYTEESAVEGVNSDVAFAQMCLETGFLRFGGLVTAEMNNFCGLGATGPAERGLIFPNPRTGVRAHIQHLKAYATEEPLKQVLVDPRFYYVRRGSSPAIGGLAGTWAEDPAYAEKIKSILERLYSFYYKP